MGLIYAISIVNWIFGKILLENIFAFLYGFQITDIPWQYYENFRNFEQGELVENLSQPTSAYFEAIFIMGKHKNFQF